MSAPRRVVISADDYGLSPGVDAAIRELLVAGRLTATSCMTTFPEWPDAAARLVDLDLDADLGVHLTLTDHAPLTPMPRTAPSGRLPSFGALLRASLRGALDLDEIRRELHAQVDAFEARVGRPPDHLDGHHHVQQLPGIASVVREVAASRLDGGWVRTCAERPGTILTRRLGAPRALAFATFAGSLRSACLDAGVPTNAGFTGVYGFQGDYGAAFGRFLHGATDGTVLMCHPGYVDALLASRDGLTAAREAEAAFLAGDGLTRALADAGVTLSRGRGLFA